MWCFLRARVHLIKELGFVEGNYWGSNDLHSCILTNLASRTQNLRDCSVHTNLKSAGERRSKRRENLVILVVHHFKITHVLRAISVATLPNEPTLSCPSLFLGYLILAILLLASKFLPIPFQHKHLVSGLRQKMSVKLPAPRSNNSSILDLFVLSNDAVKIQE